MTFLLLAFVVTTSPVDHSLAKPNLNDLRNRGREQLQAGKIPEAVVSFRKAYELAPWHAGTREDLAALREWVGDRKPPSAFRDRLGIVDIWIAAVAAGLVVIAGGVVYTRTHQKKWLLLALLGLASWSVLAVLTAPQRSEPFAVVSLERVALRSGNAESYESRERGLIPIGAEVTILSQRGGWLRVRANSGVTGWLPESSVIRGD